MVPCLTSAFMLDAPSARPRAAESSGSSVERATLGASRPDSALPATVGRMAAGVKSRDQVRGRVRVATLRGNGNQMAIVPDLSRLNSSNQKLDELAALPDGWDS